MAPFRRRGLDNAEPTARTGDALAYTLLASIRVIYTPLAVLTAAPERTNNE